MSALSRCLLLQLTLITACSLNSVATAQENPASATEAPEAVRPEVTEEQRAAADTLVTLTFYGDPSEDALAQGLAMFSKRYTQWMRSNLVREGLSEAEADAILEASGEESRRAALRQLATKLSTDPERKTALRSMLQELYAEHYSIEEMQQLIAFWSSPVGRKLYRLNPVIAEQRKQRSAELLRQPLYQMSAEVIDEQTQELTKD